MTLTITTQAADDPRICEAFGSVMNLGHDASPEEVTTGLITYMNGTTQDYERRKHQSTFIPDEIQSLNVTGMEHVEPIKK